MQVARYREQRRALYSFLSEAVKCIKTNDENLCIHFIQLAIDAYLCARELVPFTTINVRKESAGAGKGKGESSQVAVLSHYERKLTSASSSSPIPFSSETKTAITKLFDAQAAMLLITEQDAEAAIDLSGGVNFADRASTREKLSLLWRQHIHTIKFMFPNLYRTLDEKISLLPKSLEKELIYTLHQHCINALSRTKNLFSLSSEKYGWICLLNQNDTQEKQNILNEISSILVEVETQIAMAESYAGQLGEDTGISTEINQMKTKLQNWKSDISESNVSPPGKSKFTLLEEKPIKRKKMSADDSLEFQESDFFTEDSVVMSPSNRARKEEKPSTLSSKGKPMAIQILLDDRQRVRSVLAEGRPPSPLSGTMGAHTTAWVVHLDRVSCRIYGMTLKEAMQEIQKMDNEIKGNSTKKAQENPRCDALGGNFLLARLQQAIYEFFEHLNLQKGTTRDKADTTGHGEAYYRKMLIDYELNGFKPDVAVSAEDLKSAIEGLFDGKSKTEEYARHRDFIRMAYPRAYEMAYSSPPTSSSVKDASSAADDLPASTSTSASRSATTGNPGSRQGSEEAYFHRYPFPGFLLSRNLSSDKKEEETTTGSFPGASSGGIPLPDEEISEIQTSGEGQDGTKERKKKNVK